MSRLVVLSILLCSWLIAGRATADELTVVFVNPGHPQGDATGAFWADVSRFMQAAADDLNIELITLYAKRDHLLMKTLAEQVSQYKPDYAIIVNEKGVGLSLLESIAADNIPVFTLLNGFNKKELSRMSPPLKSMLIGRLIPDNFSAGKNLMADLHRLHGQRSSEPSPYTVLALRGDYSSAAALERERGLMAYLSTNGELRLIDMPVANWSKQEAQEKVAGLIRRQPIDIIWAANDPMAEGARLAMQAARIKRPTTIGGVNWDQLAIPLDVSYGGHVTLGAKALAMLQDFHQQHVLPCEMNIKIDIFDAGDRENIRHFVENTRAPNLAQFDFSRFSKSHPQAAEFTLDTFVTKKYTSAVRAAEKKSCEMLTLSL